MKKLFAILFLLLTMNLFAQQNVSVPQKYALVIGNGNYTSFGKLQNVINDANDMTDALSGLGFTVDKVLDGTRAQMVEAITRLRNRLSVSNNSYGFVFYAGHGVQFNGENYLIPANADIPSANYLGDTAVSVQTMLAELNDARNGLNIVVLDACRDFPAAWSRSMNRGLTVITGQPADSIIVYSTSAGSTASDGTGRNGLFTSQLLKNLKNPDLEVSDLFRRTGADVSQASNKQQVPAVYNQFFGTAYLTAGRRDGTIGTSGSANTSGSGTVTVPSGSSGQSGNGQAAQQQASSSGNGTQPASPQMTGTIVPGNTLTEKLIWLNRSADSHNTYILEVSANEDISPYEFYYQGAIDITIGLRGDSQNRTIRLKSSGTMFTIRSNVTFILDSNITLQGYNGNRNSLIIVNGGTLKMNDGVTITGNNATGVYVNSGTFEMTGGTISNNNTSDDGGGVWNQGTFTMSNGTISANTASSGGGVYNHGTFNMSGGIITGNTAIKSGGGVYTSYGSFSKGGGIITGYNSDSTDGNVVRDEIGTIARSGHAVWVSSDTRKETTAGSGDSLTYGGSRGTTGPWDK